MKSEKSGGRFLNTVGLILLRALIGARGRVKTEFKWLAAGVLALAMIVYGAESSGGAGTPDDSLSDLNLSPSTTLLLSFTSADLGFANLMSDEQLTNFLDVLAAAPTIPFANLATNSSGPQAAGTFYSLQHLGEWPPMPCDATHSAVWQMSNCFLVDDLGVKYDAIGKSRTTQSPGRTVVADDVTGPPGFNNTNSSSTNFQTSNVSFLNYIPYGTNLYLCQGIVSGGYLSAVASNTIADIYYELQSCTNLLQANWQSVGFFSGSELTNWTACSVFQGQQTSFFIRLRSWIDTYDIGIPDWWQIFYFGTNGINPDASLASDGYSNLQKFEMGVNPTNYYNPNGSPVFFGALNAAGTNVVLEWSNAPGPVLNYSIQRGVWNTLTGRYGYSQIGPLSSNTTFFVDAGAINGTNAQNDVYDLEAIYPGGSVSGTNTWYVSDYIQLGNEGVPYGPPLPGNLYANVDASGTNVQLSWTPASSMATNCLILRGLYNESSGAYDYVLVTNVSAAATNYTVFHAITNASRWTDVYEAEAVYPGGGLSFPATTEPDYSTIMASINVGADTNGPAAPSYFYGYPDATGTNLYLTWAPVSGTVTNYLVYGGNYDANTGLWIYQQLGRTRASTDTFLFTGAFDSNSDNLYAVYSVVAVYTNGSLSQSAAWSSDAGAPVPGAFYAWLDATGNNVDLAWTSATGVVSGYTITRYDWSFPEFQWEVGSNKTSFEDTNAVNTGAFDLLESDYTIQATYPNGGASSPLTASISSTPPAPGNLSVNVDVTGTNALLTWTKALGNVAHYVILRGAYNAATGTYNYSQIGEVNGGTASFTDYGAVASGGNDNYLYKVEAIDSDGSVSTADSAALTAGIPANYNISLTAQMVRNQTGRWQVMLSSMPTNVTAVQIYIAPYSYEWDVLYSVYEYSNNVATYFDSSSLVDTIPVGNFTNGAFVIPDSITTNEIGNNAFGKIVGVLPVATLGRVGTMALAGFLPYDAPCFVDGRQHLKQNLLFELRGATVSQPVQLTEPNFWYDPYFYGLPVPRSTNCAESSFFHWSMMNKGYGGADGLYTPAYVKMDDLWPIMVNYELNDLLYDTNYTGPSSFDWQTNLVAVPDPAVLGISDPYWISEGLTNLADVAAYTSGGNFYLKNSARNLFGLAFSTALVDTPGDNNYYPYTETFGPGSLRTLNPGGYISAADVSTFFSQTVDPSLQLSNYYFAPVNTPGTALPGYSTPPQVAPLPCLSGFSNTNQTGLLVASVGTPAVIGGWAKFSVQNSASNAYAYLGQYFVTNAFVITNGLMTTNTAGIVSPYGNFFPTQPGMVAMTTMPDINTGVQGTGVVRVISLNVDANHDGVMDFSYRGSDCVSASKPFRFWANDDIDAGDFGGNDGIPGQGSQGDGAKIMLYDGYRQPVYWVHGRRDLVDFFPVCLNIGSLFQSNALSAGISVLDTNYQCVLSQADGVLRFAYTSLTPTNYMNFLLDTNVSGVLVYSHLATISSNGVALSPSFLGGIATSNQNIILVEAATNTTQPLVMTIYHGTNQIAQTQLYLSISGVEQMFRHKNLMLNPSVTAPGDRLTDANVPNEPDTIDKNFVFLHGYNVNTNEARGVASDMYKRMYWSGSHAKFYAVTWQGADSKGSYPFRNLLTPNYHTNVGNAFLTAPKLATFIASLTNSGPVVAAAHSLGNMVVLSAISDWNAPVSQYFMMDAAVPIEAIDPTSTTNVMTFSTWTTYSNRVFASDWYQLFPTNDYRSTLNWNNRLSNLHNVDIYNFYSSGEEVLRTYTNDPPASVLNKVQTQLSYAFWNSLPFGTYTWYWQEKGKGTCTQDWFLGSSHGGWLFTMDLYGDPNPMQPAEANALSNSVLQVTPVFTFGSYFDHITGLFADWALLGTSGSAYAQANRNRILSDAIPAMSLVAGANPIPKFSPPISPSQKNFDMMTLENGWSSDRTVPENSKWHHSDFVQMAYTYTYKLFNQFVTTGNLK